MTTITINDKKEIEFDEFRDFINFINLHENDKNFNDSVIGISVSNLHRNNICVDENVFSNFINLEKMYCCWSNIILSKNALRKQKKLKYLRYIHPIPNMEYLGIFDDNVLESVAVVSQGKVTSNFFCNCKKVTYLSVSSSSFSGNCFKNLSNLKNLSINYEKVFNSVRFENIVLNSNNIECISVAQFCVKIKNNYYVNLPNLEEVRMIQIDNVYFVEALLKTSKNISYFECLNNDMHVSSLFNKKHLKYIIIQNSDVCKKNILNFVNKKKKNPYVTIYNNKKIISRDFPNNTGHKLTIFTKKWSLQ